MGRAGDLWEELSAAMERRDDKTIVDLYTHDAVWLEPHNPPHETNLLIQAYLASWLSVRENIAVSTKRLLESGDGAVLAVEWAISYDTGGRRWNDLPRASWLEAEGEAIRYQRDYY